ncbi:hypothetical protein ACLBXO_07325 [Methylobacterium sp. C33D]
MSDQTSKPHPATRPDPVTEARRREMATEHLLFGTMRFLARRHPDLLDELEGSLGHLWDTVEGEARDDEAVRTIARRMIKGLRAEQ